MSFFQNTRKPEGLGGKLMIAMMNSGHTPLATWGFSHISVAPDAAALDIGCGGGKNVELLLGMAPGGHVTGVDYSEVSVETSRKLNRDAIAAGRCDIVQGNVLELPFGDATFDVATAFETVYFWPSIEQSFAQVHRVLCPGGAFLVTNELEGRTKGAEQWTKKIDGMTAYTAEQLKDLLEGAGFTDVTVDRHASKGWICLTARA